MNAIPVPVDGCLRGRVCAAIFLGTLLTAAVCVGQTTKPAGEMADVLAVSSAFKRVAKMVTPSVVCIRVDAAEGAKLTDEEKEEVRDMIRQHYEGKIDPKILDQMLKRIDNDDREKWLPPGLGSGVIIDSDGYIVTNNHVAGGHREMTVVLGDDREVHGRLIGADPKSDLALIKIDAPGLVGLPLGDSDSMEVGDWAIAIGAPFGLSHTVTHGIISAKGRKHVDGLGIKYQDFLQTDAPINPGNSGGPLINLQGEVIGINTAMASDGGRSGGIGFSIPSSMVKKVVSQLKEGGKMRRGWLGVSYTPVTKEDREAFGLPEAKGIIVDRCVRGGPAEKAGLLVEDVITSINGEELASGDDFRDRVAELSPGQDVKLTLYRDGAARDVVITVDLQPDFDPIGRLTLPQREIKPLGIFVQTARPAKAREFDGAEQGVLLMSVVPDSPVSNIDAGSLLVAINGKPVRTAGQLLLLLSEAPRGEKVKLEFLNTFGDRTIKFVLPKQ